MMRHLVRVAAAAVVAVAVAALAALAPGSPLAASCAGAGSNRAALVVEHGDGSILTRCVTFDAATITGEGLMNASGVAWAGQSFGGFGVAVCAIDAEPAHYSTCPGKDSYWAVFISRGGGSWGLSSIGISSLTLGDGDAVGFRFVPAVGSPEPPPSPAGVCAPAAPAPTNSPGSGAVTTPRGLATPPVSAVPSSVSAASVATATGQTTALVGAAAASAGGSASSASAGGSASSAPAGGSASSASSTPDLPGPVPSGRADLGLMLAAVVGGGLAGLALLRVIAARRRPS